MSRVSATPRATASCCHIYKDSRDFTSKVPHDDLVSQQGRNKLYCIRGQAQ